MLPLDALTVTKLPLTESTVASSHTVSAEGSQTSEPSLMISEGMEKLGWPLGRPGEVRETVVARRMDKTYKYEGADGDGENLRTAW